MIEILEELGVQITGQSGDEIQGYCPVHHLTVGREQDKPKWYINADSGAWLCFTCHQKGSLVHLVEALGGDEDTIEHLRMQAAVSITKRWDFNNDGEVSDPEYDGPQVSDEAFNANPRPPIGVMDRKDVDPDVCESYNVRWDTVGKCWLLPVYSVIDGQLLGWQEKSKGYFNNVPTSMSKSLSLFGWHTYDKGDLIVVESPLDALRFASHGYQAVATFGSFLSPVQAERITYAIDGCRIVLAFDNDDAGDHAMRQAAEYLDEWADDPFYRFFKYPAKSRGMDPGELSVPDLHNGVEQATRFNKQATKEKDNGNWTPQRHPASRRDVRQRRPQRSVW